MQDTIHCNKEILKTNIHNTTHKKELKLNVKAKLQDIISHSCEGNIKATWDFLYLKGCTSAYFVLFLNLGQIALPSHASQFQLSIQIMLCTFGGLGHPSPPSPTGAPPYQGSHVHKSGNLDDTKHFWEPAQLQMPLVGQERHTLQMAAVVFSSPLWSGPQAWDELWCLARGTGISCLFFNHLPFFLLVSSGFHIRKKEQNQENHQISASFTANTWFKRKINKRKLIKPRVWPQKRLVWFYNTLLKPGWIWSSKYIMPFPKRHLISIIFSWINKGFWEGKLGEGSQTEINNFDCSAGHSTSIQSVKDTKYHHWPSIHSSME